MNKIEMFKQELNYIKNEKYKENTKKLLELVLRSTSIIYRKISSIIFSRQTRLSKTYKSCSKNC